MKIFRGDRSETGAIVTEDGRPLPLRLKLRNHSPTGFEWGYGGSGPAQLALAICSAVVSDQRALAVYQRFKFRVIGGIEDQHWELTEAEVLRVIEEIEAEEKARGEK